MGKILRKCGKNKGSLENPFLYFGLISVILLSVLGFFAPPLLSGIRFQSKTTNLQASLLNVGSVKASISSQSQDKNSENSPFVGLAKSSPKESPELVFIQGNSLIAGVPPNVITSETLGSLTGSTDEQSSSRREISEYIVQEGDSLISIAEKFDISLETLLWANDLTGSSKIRPGQSLIIMPVSGVLYYVKAKDTLSNIAKTYKGDVDEIIAFNELSSADDIYIGDILVIPDGVVPKKAKASPSAPVYAPVATGYFICPVSSPCVLTQGLHWYNAVDLRSKCGNPAYAAAGGTVLKAKSYGWNGGAGNYVTVLHSNGVVTLYAHLQAVHVTPGQYVSQGEIIGLTGRTGQSTGCHMHFEVRGAKNPFSR